MSDTNRAQIASLKETNWGVTPGSAMTRKRFTSESLGFDISNTKSAEIRSDRQIQDLIQNGAEATGGVNIELSYGSYDDELLAALQGSGWSTAVAISATDISAVAADNSLNSTITDFTTKNLSAGQWVKIGGFTGVAANNDYARVESVAANKVVVSGLTLADDAAGETVTIDGSGIVNGTTQHSFSLEKTFADIAQFISFTGMMVNDLTLNVASRSVLTGALSYVGKDSAIAQASIGTGTEQAASTTKVMSAVTNLKAFRENNAIFPASGNTDYLKNISISLKNNLAGKDGVGFLGNVGIRSGECDVSGTFQAYFENETIYEKYVNATESSVSFRLEDPTTPANAYIVSLPRIRYGQGKVVVGGGNNDVLIDAQYQALAHATFGHTIRIDKF